MKKNSWIILGVFMILVGAGAVLLASRSNEAPRGTVAQAKSKATKSSVTPTCLTKNDDLKLNSDDQTSIEQGLVTQLIDVPAGVNTEINFTTYDQSRATGTEVYPDSYGKYNFVAKKDGSTWKIKSFVACKD